MSRIILGESVLHVKVASWISIYAQEITFQTDDEVGTLFTHIIHSIPGLYTKQATHAKVICVAKSTNASWQNQQ